MDNANYGTPGSYYRRTETGNGVLSGDLLKYYYGTTSGRISRLEYLIATVMPIVVTIAFSFFMSTFFLSSLLTGNFLTAAGGLGLWWLMGGLLQLVLCVASFIAAAKRAHDRNRSGWFVLLYFVPLLNLWPFIELYFLPGTIGDNPYGNDPLTRFHAGYGAPLQPPHGGGAQPFSAGPAATQPPLGVQAPLNTQATQSARSAFSGLLRCTAGEYANTTMPLDAAGLVIGRDANRCNLILQSGQISRVHAKVSLNPGDGTFLVEDLGSTNGVYVNSKRIDGRCSLVSGQSFRLGQDAATFTVQMN